MILYHGTSKENAESIKRNGFSLEYVGKSWGSTYGKVIYFTNCYKTAKCYSGSEGYVLTVDIDNVNYLKLDKDYSPNNNNHITQIKSIIMYVKINTNKNCLLNYSENEYIFFNKFNYRIIL